MDATDEHNFGAVVFQPWSWMSLIDNDRLISDLSIPGTHDSGTEESGDGPAHTQNFSIERQLRDGIRFLDIRLKDDPYHSTLQVYHGFVHCKLEFDEILDWCKAFLDANPSEVILMSIANNNDNQDISGQLNDYFDREKWKDMFYRGTCLERMPTLGEVRGKVMVFKNFSHQDKVTGFIDWHSGTSDRGSSTYSFVSSAMNVMTGKDYFSYRISDEFNQHDTEKKWDIVRNHLITARTGFKQNFYVTFNSIAWAAGHRTPYQYAWGYKIFGIQQIKPIMNDALRDFIREEVLNIHRVSPIRYGVIALDFYNNHGDEGENRLVEYIIRSNFGD